MESDNSASEIVLDEKLASEDHSNSTKRNSDVYFWEERSEALQRHLLSSSSSRSSTQDLVSRIEHFHRQVRQAKVYFEPRLASNKAVKEDENFSVTDEDQQTLFKNGKMRLPKNINIDKLLVSCQTGKKPAKVSSFFTELLSTSTRYPRRAKSTQKLNAEQVITAFDDSDDDLFAPAVKLKRATNTKTAQLFSSYVQTTTATKTNTTTRLPQVEQAGQSSIPLQKARQTIFLNDIPPAPHLVLSKANKKDQQKNITTVIADSDEEIDVDGDEKVAESLHASKRKRNNEGKSMVSTAMKRARVVKNGIVGLINGKTEKNEVSKNVDNEPLLSRIARRNAKQKPPSPEPQQMVVDIACPMCGKNFTEADINEHAFNCMGSNDEQDALQNEPDALQDEPDIVKGKPDILRYELGAIREKPDVLITPVAANRNEVSVVRPADVSIVLDTPTEPEGGYDEQAWNVACMNMNSNHETASHAPDDIVNEENLRNFAKLNVWQEEKKANSQEAASKRNYKKILNTQKDDSEFDEFNDQARMAKHKVPVNAAKRMGLPHKTTSSVAEKRGRKLPNVADYIVNNKARTHGRVNQNDWLSDDDDDDVQDTTIDNILKPLANGGSNIGPKQKISNLKRATATKFNESQDSIVEGAELCYLCKQMFPTADYQDHVNGCVNDMKHA